MEAREKTTGKARKKHTVLKIVLVCLIAVIAIAAIYPFIPKAQKLPSITKLNDTTYHFADGSTNSCMYLLLGEDRALLIDTGFGRCKLDEAIKSITDLPVTVVNTHGHYDHVGNNALFDDIYMSEKDFELYAYYAKPETLDWVYGQVPFIFRHFMRQEIEIVKSHEPVPVKPLPPEGYFDLGGRTITFFETPGHTPGSICLYDEGTHWLFVGDTAGTLLNLPLSLSVETYLESVEIINAFIEENQVAAIYPGHMPIARDPSIFRSFEQACKDIISGDISDKDMEKGEHTVDGVTINFYPNMILKSDEQ